LQGEADYLSPPLSILATGTELYEKMVEVLNQP